MLKTMLTGVLAFLMLLNYSFLAQAQFSTSQNIPVAANIPSQNGFNVTVNRITLANGVWTSASSVDFGTLAFDSNLGIFLSSYIYTVDIGVTANFANWQITHTRTSLARAGGGDLNSNVNVSFVKQLSPTTDQPLEKVIYLNSNSKTYNKSQLDGGWLRIYYGIATGNAANDAPGASPIGVGKPSGAYQGQVTLTLLQL